MSRKTRSIYHSPRNEINRQFPQQLHTIYSCFILLQLWYAYSTCNWLASVVFVPGFIFVFVFMQKGSKQNKIRKKQSFLSLFNVSLKKIVGSIHYFSLKNHELCFIFILVIEWNHHVSHCFLKSIQNLDNLTHKVLIWISLAILCMTAKKENSRKSLKTLGQIQVILPFFS